MHATVAFSSLYIYDLLSTPRLILSLLLHLLEPFKVTKAMNIFQDWPEPIVRVQSLSESNLGAIPNRYVKPLSQRPNITTHNKHNPHTTTIPIIDLGRLYTDDLTLQAKTLDEISKACREWGFFQVVNHGMSPQLMDQAKATWREFFHLPMELKNMHANSPKTYEGYGSRLGVEKGAILDWSDYYYLHYQPSSLKDYTKWPSLPLHCRYVLFQNFFFLN